MYEAANAGLDMVIDKTIAQLVVYREAHDGHDEGFVRKLVTSFVEQAAHSQHGAGAIMMGLSAYRLAILQLQIDRLEEENCGLRDAVEMREAGLQLMWAIADEAEESAGSD